MPQIYFQKIVRPNMINFMTVLNMEKVLQKLPCPTLRNAANAKTFSVGART